MLTVLNAIGTVGELFYIAGLLMLFTAGAIDWSSFFKKHRMLALVFTIGCIIGVIYFDIHLFTKSN